MMKLHVFRQRKDPPRSPHFNGLWEAGVTSFKNHYCRGVGSQLFTYEELETYTTEIEAILNSRLLTPLSEDPNDLRALAPAHLLIRDTFTTLPNKHQYITQYFWKRWSKEYLNQLNVRSK